MTKTRMICPFSAKLCKECALFRGRHYYLRFCKDYRGYMDEAGEITRPIKFFTSSSNNKFQIPAVIATNAIDPFLIDLNNIKKEE